MLHTTLQSNKFNKSCVDRLFFLFVSLSLISFIHVDRRFVISNGEIVDVHVDLDLNCHK